MFNIGLIGKPELAWWFLEQMLCSHCTRVNNNWIGLAGIVGAEGGIRILPCHHWSIWIALKKDLMLIIDGMLRKRKIKSLSRTLSINIPWQLEHHFKIQFGFALRNYFLVPHLIRYGGFISLLPCRQFCLQFVLASLLWLHNQIQRLNRQWS